MAIAQALLVSRLSGRSALAFIALLVTPSCGGRGGGLFVGTVSRSQFFEYHDEIASGARRSAEQIIRDPDEQHEPGPVT